MTKVLEYIYIYPYGSKYPLRRCLGWVPGGSKYLLRRYDWIPRVWVGIQRLSQGFRTMAQSPSPEVHPASFIAPNLHPEVYRPKRSCNCGTACSGSGRPVHPHVGRCPRALNLQTAHLPGDRWSDRPPKTSHPKRPSNRWPEGTARR